MIQRRLFHLTQPIGLAINNDTMVAIDKVLIDTTNDWRLVNLFSQERIVTTYDYLIPPVYRNLCEFEDDSILWSVTLSKISSKYIAPISKNIEPSKWVRLENIEIDMVLGFMRFYFTDNYTFESPFIEVKTLDFDLEDVYNSYYDESVLPKASN